MQDADEAVCTLCGTVAQRDVAVVDIDWDGRAPMNHGVDGKNLGTPQTRVYRELTRLGQVAGALKPWELDRFNESDSILFERIRAFSALMLRRGLKDAEIDPLARSYRRGIREIRETVEAEVQEMRVRRLRARLDEYDMRVLGVARSIVGVLACKSQ